MAAEAGRSTVWSTEQVPGQSLLQRETLSWKQFFELKLTHQFAAEKL